jgi:hypothetical protein
MEAADHKKKAGQYRTLSRGYGSLNGARQGCTRVPPKLMSALGREQVQAEKGSPALPGQEQKTDFHHCWCRSEPESIPLCRASKLSC